MSLSGETRTACAESKTLRVVRGLAAGAAAAAALLLYPSAYAQDIPHDPALLSKLRTRDFKSIEGGSTSALGLTAIIRGYSDAGCRGAAAGGSASEVLQLTQSLIAEAGGVGQLLLIAAHPNYIHAGSMAGANGCESKLVQTTMNNLIEYLRQRYARAPVARNDGVLSAARKAELAKLAPTPLKFSDPGDYPDYPIGEENSTVPGIAEFRRSSPAKVLKCVYGYANFYFWREKVWHPHKQVSAIHPQHPLLQVPEKVVATCPATMADAWDLSGFVWR